MNEDPFEDFIEATKREARLQMAAEYELPFEVRYWKGLSRGIEINFKWKDLKGKWSPWQSTDITLPELKAGALKVICGAEISGFHEELIDRVFHMAHEAGRFTGNE